jgi:hypothetical protein
MLLTYGSVGGEPVLGCGTSVGERELESWLEELLDVRPPDVFLLLNLGDSEDLDIPKSGSVSGGHVLVHGLDSLSSGESSELLDHLYVSAVLESPDGEHIRCGYRIGSRIGARWRSS